MVLLDSVVEVFNFAHQDRYGTASADRVNRRLVASKMQVACRDSKAVFL
jgi:hypothetical protein